MNCIVCKRPLRSEKAQRLGMGRTCAERFHRDQDHQFRIAPLTSVSDLPFGGDVWCVRDAGTGQKRFNIPHKIIRHSPTGMDWGHRGDSARDFSLNILYFITGAEHAEEIYDKFTRKFVANIPINGGSIKADDVQTWLDENDIVVIG